MPIARGMVYPIGDGTIYGGPLIPYYIKVSIDSFVPAFGDTKLPVVSKANDTITLLEQSVWSFFQWPRCRISRTLPCVKAAYLRWTTRDDDTADHIFEVPGGMIVGHEDTFHVRVSTEDIMKLWNFDGLHSSILLSFEWGLCKMLESRNDNRCGKFNLVLQYLHMAYLLFSAVGSYTWTMAKLEITFNSVISLTWCIWWSDGETR
nr:ulp1 protease family, C-terminal catalytic domain-containing protein [Tanacetum cinerariifolium]